MKYTGSCHCKNISFEIECDEIKEVMDCNCSHCRRKGFLMIFMPRSNFNLLSADSITTYKFNRKTIEHIFCPFCGIEAFSFSHHNNTDMTMINVRGLDNLDLDSLIIKKVEGKNF